MKITNEKCQELLNKWSKDWNCNSPIFIGFGRSKRTTWKYWVKACYRGNKDYKNGSI